MHRPTIYLCHIRCFGHQSVTNTNDVLVQLSVDYTAQLARCEAVEAEAAALRREYAAVQDRSGALAAECDARAAALEAATQHLQEARSAQASSSAAWDSERGSLQVYPPPCDQEQQRSQKVPGPVGNMHRCQKSRVITRQASMCNLRRHILASDIQGRSTVRIWTSA